MHTGGISKSILCDCDMQHTIRRIVDIRLQTRFDGDTSRTKADAVNWLENLEIKL